MYSCCVLIVTKFTDFPHVRNQLYFKTVLVPFCLTVVQNMEERDWNVLLSGDFLCRILVVLPFSFFQLFCLFSAVLMFHLVTQVCLYNAHQLLCYLAGPVLLLAICIGCVLLGRHQGHHVVDTWISNSLRVVGLPRVSLCLITPCCEDQNYQCSPYTCSAWTGRHRMYKYRPLFHQINTLLSRTQLRFCVSFDIVCPCSN